MSARLRRWLVSLPCLALAILLAGAADADGLPTEAQRELWAWLRPGQPQQVLAALGPQAVARLPVYDLALEVDPERRTFQLREQITYRSTSPVPERRLVLRIYGNVRAKAGSGPRVKLLGGSCQPTPCRVRQSSASVVEVELAKPLGVAAALQMDLRLSGSIDAIDSSRTSLLGQGLEGLAAMGSGERQRDYGLIAAGDGITTLVSFYATLARRAGNGWDASETSTLGDLVSDELCHFRASITAPSRFNIVAGGAVTTDRVELHALGQGKHRRRVEVRAGFVRDFGVVLGELVSSSVKLGSLEVQAHYSARDSRAGERALSTAARAFSSFERRFGPYPYRRFDLIEAPIVGGAGGVELSGSALIASMLYRPALPVGGPMAMLSGLLGGRGSAALRQMSDGVLELTVAHEVAHQWWHVLVGSDSREHPFVDEALAQYSALIYLEDRYGSREGRKRFDANAKLNYQLFRWLGGADEPVDQPTAGFDSPLAYAGIVYGKGPYLYDELRRLLGDEEFFARLRQYADRHRFRSAGPRALVDLLATGPRASAVRATVRRYLDESHGDEDLGQPNLTDLLPSRR